MSAINRPVPRPPEPRTVRLVGCLVLAILAYIVTRF